MHVHCCSLCGHEEACEDDCAIVERGPIDDHTRAILSAGVEAVGKDERCSACAREFDEDSARPTLRTTYPATLRVAVDTGASGAYAFEVRTGSAQVLAALDVRSLGVDERTTLAGKTRKLASADVLADELGALIRVWRDDGADLDLLAWVEVPAPMPGQGSSTTGSQFRSLGRIEGVLVGLGFRVETLPPQRWRRALDLKSGGTTAASNPEAGAIKKATKAASVILACGLCPELAAQIGDDDNRAEAVLILTAACRGLLGRGGHQ
jgi:hypothetical protein